MTTTTKHVPEGQADVQNCDFCGEPWPCADYRREQYRLQQSRDEAFEEWWRAEGRHKAAWTKGYTIEEERQKLMRAGWDAALDRFR